MDTVLQDIRYGIRTLVGNPGLSLVAIFALTLGIGANTAIFSVANGILLRSLPYPHSERIVTIWTVLPEKLGLANNRGDLSAGQFTDFRNGSDAFDLMGGFNQSSLNQSSIFPICRPGSIHWRWSCGQPAEPRVWLWRSETQSGQ